MLAYVKPGELKGGLGEQSSGRPGNTLKLSHHSVAGNGRRDGSKNGADDGVREHAGNGQSAAKRSVKAGERSETRDSSLTGAISMATSPRVPGVGAYALIDEIVRATAKVVEARDKELGAITDR